jgi:transposase
MPASYVKAYVKRNQNDAADAAAICEAVMRPSMRFVPIKTAEQQAALMLHRTRDLLVRQRTQLINAIRAHLAELGLVAATGRDGVQALPPLGMRRAGFLILRDRPCRRFSVNSKPWACRSAISSVASMLSIVRAKRASSWRPSRASA